MTTTIDVITDGTTTSLTDEDPFFIESIDGVGASPGHLIESRGPQQHGATVEGYRLDPREIEIVVGFLSEDGLSDPNRAALLSLVSLGVWLGLIPRYNSWDAVVRPLDVVGSALWALTNPPTLLCLAAFAVVLGVLTSVVNAAWDAAAERLTRRA